MGLKAQVSSLDEVPEALREMYVEVDGNWRLDVEGVEFADDVAGLKRTLAKYKRDSKHYQDKLSAFADVDLDEVARLREMAAELEAKQGEETDVEKVKQRMTASHQKEVERLKEKMQGEISGLMSFVERLVVKDALDEAIREAGVVDHHRKAVHALLKERGRPKAVQDGADYIGVASTSDGDEITIQDFVSGWARSEEAAHYLKASGKGGSGADPTGRHAGANGKTFDRNDPTAWGQFAEAVVKGEATPS